MAAAAFRIPLSPSAHQSLTIQLAGIDYRLTLQWREAGLQGWLLDIADVNGDPIVCGIALVMGCNLLAQYSHLKFGGELWLWGGPDRSAPPTFDDLGVTKNLYFITGGTLNWLWA
jgi:hypothetical protein